MITGYPFDNIDYSSADVAASFADIVSNGVNVFGNADALKVYGSGLSLTITNGTGRINGRVFQIKDQTLSVDAGNAIARIDRVVVKMDAESTNGSFSVYVKKGASTAPELTRNASGSIYEISLATLTVTNSTVSIHDDRQDASLCGYVSFLGNEPFYPSGSIPESLWVYTVYPDELTSDEKSVVEGNSALMNKYKASEVYQNKIYTGVFTGDGASSRKISLPKTPKFVFLTMGGMRINYETTTGSAYYGGLAIAGNPVQLSSERKIIEIVESGFNVFENTSNASPEIHTNYSGSSYFYIWG